MVVAFASVRVATAYLLSVSERWPSQGRLLLLVWPSRSVLSVRRRCASVGLCLWHYSLTRTFPLQRSRDGASSQEWEEEEDYVPYVPVRERKRAALENRLIQRQPVVTSDTREDASAEGSKDMVSRSGNGW